MKADPISAAHAYRQALQAVMKAQTLHEARQRASKALDVTFDKPEDTHISVGSGYGHNTNQPFVTIGIANPTESANPIVQLPTDEARRQALTILEAADAAESDGFLITWLGNQDLSLGQLATLLADFRAWREQWRKQSEG